jgi:ATP-dependent DNA helicase RecQ
MQQQAAYILPAVHKALKKWAGASTSHQLQLAGLLEGISTFDVITVIPKARAEPADSILAVVTNLLTRGLPTLPSVFVEDELASSLGLTERKLETHLGKIRFPFCEGLAPDAESLLNALHPIVSNRIDVGEYYDKNDLDGGFEEFFIFDLLKAQPWLPQLLQKQRPLTTVAEGFPNGNIDFSLEIPTWELHTRKNKFRKDSPLRYNRVFIAEVDGAAYHEASIDSARDFATASMGNDTVRVLEHAPIDGAEAYADRLAEKEYVQRHRANFQDANFQDRSSTKLILQPLAVARIQRVVLWYLMSKHWLEAGKPILKIAILERDITCGNLAIEDLRTTLKALYDVVDEDVARVQVEEEVFRTGDFQPADCASYDLVIDVSMLRRTGIFKEDREWADRPNVVQIRNCHYVAGKTINPVISAKRINYRVEDAGPVTALTAKDASDSGLTKFLRDIFRKTSFRPGQLPILARVFRGKSVIGLLPTGGGKSLTYQLAALLQPGITIVVDPIRSLMADQDRSLREMLIDKTTYVNSTLNTGERTYIQNEMMPKGRLHFLFISPERFVIQEFRNVLGKCGEAGHFTSYVVIDEAHCVSEWGHDFRIPYLNLGVNAQEFCPTFDQLPAPLFGLTATASFDVLADIERELQIIDDDGDAVVRFENTVRDEVNYNIRLIPGDYDGINDSATKYDPEKIVGRSKQKEIYELLEGKIAAIRPYDDYATIRQIAEYSYENYLSDVELAHLKSISTDGSDAKQWYSNETAKRVRFREYESPFGVHDDGTFGYGVVVFAPHRTGWLGIRNGSNTFGVIGNSNYVSPVNFGDGEEEVTGAVSKTTSDALGFFMGSSDDEGMGGGDTDRMSFAHMDRFTANKNSVMVATKAFGMGIDKSNIRMTIHLSLPSSIESYVQEAGRAGRDKKSALSVVLFNDEVIEYKDVDMKKIHVDYDVLNFFHQRSFKGQMKERTMLFELRDEVLPPRSQRKYVITDELQALLPDFTNLKLNYRPATNRMYVNADEISMDHYFTVGTAGGMVWPTLSFDLIDTIREKIAPGLDLIGFTFQQWWEEWVTPEGVFTGVEVQFRNLNVGETRTLTVYTTNKYYSKPTRSEADFKINADHLELVYNRAVDIVGAENSFARTLNSKLREAVRQNYGYQEFIESYRLEENEEQILLDNNNLNVQKLQRAYYADRSDQDTAKAIYRLNSIGIIDTYTIDYQNKKYNIEFTKHENEWYFKTLEEFVARYSSKRRAGKLIQKLVEEKEADLAAGSVTPISICLEFLTDYIYDNIRLKRQRAIQDMIELCRGAVQRKDLTEQNLFIKDEIFFYFNAKYSRPGFKELAGDTELPASMYDDLEEDLPIADFVDKYLRLVEDTDTGEFINNTKHLRGSCMRMLRSYPKEPQLFILKSFSLFVMGNITPAVRAEGVVELARGLSEWKEREQEFHLNNFVSSFKLRLEAHVNYDTTQYLEEALETAFVIYSADWLEKFNNKILATHE